MILVNNEVITGFKYDPSGKNPIRYGLAAVAANGYPYVNNAGLLRAEIAGKDYWDNVGETLKVKCAPFLDHLTRLFTGDTRDVDVFLDYMAFKQQYPGVKPRWALVVAGEQGVGKDIAIDACWHEYGLNFINNISPADVMGAFNDYAKCMLLRISEVADLGESNKWMFNEKVKVLISGHPDRMHINPKYGFKYWLNLYNGTVLTTNHLTDGLYIPAGDRRYYVIKCASWNELGDIASNKAEYFDKLFNWFRNGDGVDGVPGYTYIGNYLFWGRDVSGFDVNVCPEETAAKLEVINAGAEVPDWLDEALVTYSNIVTKTAEDLNGAAGSPAGDFRAVLLEVSPELRPRVINVRKLKDIIDALGTERNLTNGRIIAGLKRAGYEKVESGSKDGKWQFRVDGKQAKETFYALSDEIGGVGAVKGALEAEGAWYAGAVIVGGEIPY